MTPTKELALFVKLWLATANEKSKELTLPLYARGEVFCITEATPSRLSHFILDFTLLRGRALEIYKVTACGSTFIARVEAVEAEDGLELKITPRDPKILTESDVIRLLTTYKASVEGAVALVSRPSAIKYDISLSGELFFEEELLLIGKTMIELAGIAIHPSAAEWVGNYTHQGYLFHIAYDADAWQFALRKFSKTPHTEENRPLLLFRVNAHGKLGKEPFVTSHPSRAELLTHLRDFIPLVQEKSVGAQEARRHAR